PAYKSFRIAINDICLLHEMSQKSFCQVLDIMEPLPFIAGH
ncbi:MAG: hypothetical protein ACJARG_001252, partial [Arcticibacterium sp.]